MIVLCLRSDSDFATTSTAYMLFSRYIVAIIWSTVTAQPSNILEWKENIKSEKKKTLEPAEGNYTQQAKKKHTVVEME